MSQDNERVLREFLAAFESGDTETIRGLADPDIVDHTLPPGGVPGIEGVAYAVSTYQEAFSDLRIAIEKVVADDDCAVAYGRVTGRHTGSLFGTAATGKAVDFGYIDIYRIDAGRITESWHIEDVAGLMHQISGST